MAREGGGRTDLESVQQLEQGYAGTDVRDPAGGDVSQVLKGAGWSLGSGRLCSISHQRAHTGPHAPNPPAPSRPNPVGSRPFARGVPTLRRYPDLPASTARRTLITRFSDFRSGPHWRMQAIGRSRRRPAASSLVRSTASKCLTRRTPTMCRSGPK